jgi:hypothetical protein
VGRRYQSSLLPLDREIPDTRISECKALDYDIASLPKHSVIICFVDESWCVGVDVGVGVGVVVEADLAVLLHLVCWCLGVAASQHPLRPQLTHT